MREKSLLKQTSFETSLNFTFWLLSEGFAGLPLGLAESTSMLSIKLSKSLLRCFKELTLAFLVNLINLKGFFGF